MAIGALLGRAAGRRHPNDYIAAAGGLSIALGLPAFRRGRRRSTQENWRWLGRVSCS